MSSCQEDPGSSDCFPNWVDHVSLTLEAKGESGDVGRVEWVESSSVNNAPV